jgi:hypothetical protein
MTNNQICTICKQDNPNCNRKCKECVIMADKENIIVQFLKFIGIIRAQ